MKEDKCIHFSSWASVWKSVCCSVTKSRLTFCNPKGCSTPGLPVHHQLLEFTQTHVHWVDDAIPPSHPLSSPSPPAPNPSQHQGLFQWVGSLHQVAKVLDLQLQHQSFQWIFRVALFLWFCATTKHLTFSMPVPQKILKGEHWKVSQSHLFFSPFPDTRFLLTGYWQESYLHSVWILGCPLISIADYYPCANVLRIRCGKKMYVSCLDQSVIHTSYYSCYYCSVFMISQCTFNGKPPTFPGKT